MGSSGGRTIAMVAQGLSWLLNGSTLVAVVIAKWTLFFSVRRHNGGTGEAEASPRLTMLPIVRILPGDHCASNL